MYPVKYLVMHLVTYCDMLVVYAMLDPTSWTPLHSFWAWSNIIFTLVMYLVTHWNVSCNVSLYLAMYHVKYLVTYCDLLVVYAMLDPTSWTPLHSFWAWSNIIFTLVMYLATHCYLLVLYAMLDPKSWAALYPFWAWSNIIFTLVMYLVTHRDLFRRSTHVIVHASE